MTTETLTAAVDGTLQDVRGWKQAGFTFVLDEASPLMIVLAEPGAVDQLCSPLHTAGKVSCQNGPIVAINADRWRKAVPHWSHGLANYQSYVVNHEVGHLVGQRHPMPSCPFSGRPAAVMSQQTRALGGCEANPWPRPWEIELASLRPAVIAPSPEWAPGPPPGNPGT